MHVFEKFEALWRIRKYNNEEIKIFDNFDDIEAKFETTDILTMIKKNNIQIEKKFLKQNKKYKYSNKDSSHKLSEVFYVEIYDFLNNDKGERYPKD